jgi:hypothetical protein
MRDVFHSFRTGAKKSPAPARSSRGQTCTGQTCPGFGALPNRTSDIEKIDCENRLIFLLMQKRCVETTCATYNEEEKNVI